MGTPDRAVLAEDKRHAAEAEKQGGEEERRQNERCLYSKEWMERLITDPDRELCATGMANGGITPGPGMEECEEQGKEYQIYNALAWAEEACHSRAVFEGYMACDTEAGGGGRWDSDCMLDHPVK